jgi:hypothetical protein
MDSIVELIKDFPSAIQAALIASAFGLISVLISAVVACFTIWRTNVGHERRLRLQFVQDDQRKRIEREMDLRKAIYLDVAEAIHAGLAAIGKHNNIEIDQPDLLTTFEVKSAAVSKAHLIAGQSLVDALQMIGREFHAAILHLSLERVPLLRLRAEKKILEGSIKNYAAKRDEYVNRMGDLPVETPEDRKKFELLDSRYRFEHDRVDKALTQIRVIDKKLSDGGLALSLEVSRIHSEVRLKVPAILKAARDELQLPLDIAHYEEKLREGILIDQAQLRTFINRIRENISQQNS